MYRVLICDNDERRIYNLKIKILNYFQKQKDEVDIVCKKNLYKILELAEQRNMYDIYFVNITMKEELGESVIRKILECNKNALIIASVKDNKCSINICNLNIFIYVDIEKLLLYINKIMDQCMEKLQQNESEKFYIIKNKKSYIKFLQKEIAYIYRYKKNIIFAMKDGSENRERTSLKSVYEKLENDNMCFLDRGLIVNTNYIYCVKNNIIELKNGIQISTSNEKTNIVLEKLKE